MTVITNKPGDKNNALGNGKCSICAHTLFCYPFLAWRGRLPAGATEHLDLAGDTFICGKCCKSNKRGLVADLIQVTAIMELADVGYWDRTLTRGRIKDVEVAERDDEGYGPREPARRATSQ
jgi:hypothetical protein